MKNKIVENNIGLVKSCISRFSYHISDYEDIFQAGCLGLTKASINFDDMRGTKFSSYAVPYILGEIKSFFEKNGKIKVSKIVKKNYRDIQREKEKFIKLNNREPSLKEISEILNISIEETLEALECSKPILSTDEDNNLNSSFEESHEKKVSEKIDVQKAIRDLGEIERKIINMRFFKLKTQSDSAKILGMTQVQISRKEKKILQILRKKLS